MIVRNLCSRFGLALMVAALISFIACPLASAQNDSPEEVFGSGNAYQTVINRHTEGDLTVADLSQASVLGGRIVHHLNQAVIGLTDAQPQAARQQIDHGLTLTRIIREMLPVTVVETIVKDRSGKVVYRSTDRIQDDKIPLFRHSVALEVMQPIIDAKEKEAEIRGVQLAEADILYTSVLLDLGYVERKFRRARTLLDADQAAEALEQLVLAQTNGIEFIIEQEDHPLVEALAALRVAEDMVVNERFEAARANLQIARNQIEIYRGLMGTAADEKVRNLDREIASLMKKVDEPGGIEQIRKFRERIRGWFTTQPHQATPTETTKPTSAEGTVSTHREK